jgi:hypothetical protein
MKENEVSGNAAVRKFVSDNVPTKKGENELVIRHGHAALIHEPNAVELNGVITAPRMFFEKRASLHDPNKCHVVYDRLKGQIVLTVDEQCEDRNYTVTGTLQDNPELAPFKINSTSMMGVKDLMQILKFNRIFFVDQDDNAKIVAALQNFKAKVDQELVDSNDNRGAQNQTKISKLEHSLQESFVLSMPLFKGQPAISFRVEICVQITNGGVVVWLESRELKDLQMSSKAAIISKEIEAFKDIVCIEI